MGIWRQNWTPENEAFKSASLDAFRWSGSLYELSDIAERAEAQSLDFVDLLYAEEKYKSIQGETQDSSRRTAFPAYVQWVDQARQAHEQGPDEHNRFILAYAYDKAAEEAMHLAEWDSVLAWTDTTLIDRPDKALEQMRPNAIMHRGIALLFSDRYHEARELLRRNWRLLEADPLSDDTGTKFQAELSALEWEGIAIPDQVRSTVAEIAREMAQEDERH
jgi:hypothetical protein